MHSRSRNKKQRKLWGGRFKKGPDAEFEAFSASLAEDCRLAPYDIQASIAHCQMLRRIGILSVPELRKLERSLKSIERDLPKFKAVFQAQVYEDVHTFLEQELVRRVGASAKKIHTARSRNDQVNQATRLYCKHQLGIIIDELRTLQISIVRLAIKHKHVLVTGYTHLQKAQPILISHLLLSYVEVLDRSREALTQTRERLDTLTLGSGALAGTTIPIDRDWVCRKLDAQFVGRNSLDAVGNRDFVAEICFHLSLIGTHLSRISEDLMIGQMDEIGWYELPEELCTGSSMLPQKRNPDFVELARGASAQLIGGTVSILTLLKGLPSSYNRDLQWDKQPLFQSVELTQSMLRIFSTLFKRLKIRASQTLRSLEDDQFLAIDLAEMLVMRGVPFRDAHERVGHFVQSCLAKKISFREVAAPMLKRELGLDPKSYRRALSPLSSVTAKRSKGSTHPREVERQLRFWRKKLVIRS